MTEREILDILFAVLSVTLEGAVEEFNTMRAEFQALSIMGVVIPFLGWLFALIRHHSSDEYQEKILQDEELKLQLAKITAQKFNDLARRARNAGLGA